MRQTLFVTLLTALTLGSGCADQQVADATYRTGGASTPFYGRTDGLVHHATYQTPYLSVNGEVNIMSDSPAFYESFTDYEDGEDLSTFQIDGTAFDGTAGVVNLATTSRGFRFGYSAIVAQTLNVDMDAGSLDIGADQLANDGYMLWTGYAGATGRPFVVGHDAAFETCITFSLEDASGTDDFHFGFRRAEVANATVDNYNDMATLSIVTSANPALIQLETIDDNGATTTTNTTNTLADTISTKWCVLVSGSGVVTYTIDGAAPTTTAAFTFDDGDPVVPFLDYLQAADLTGEIDITEWYARYTR